MPTDKRPVISVRTIAALLLVLASAATFSSGVLPWTGFGLALLNLGFAVVDVVLRRRLLAIECSEMPTTMCMLLNNVFGIVPSMLLCFCTGELLDIDTATAFSSHTIAILI